MWRDWSDELFDAYELVFAVNRAGLFRCHYWGFVDDDMTALAESGRYRPEIGFFTNRRLRLDRTIFSLGLYGGDVVRLEEAGIDPMQTGQCYWTMPCLLKEAGNVADSLGMPLDIYGLDCSPEHWTRWRMELPWVRYAMPENVREIRGDLDERWRQWILGSGEEILEPQIHADQHGLEL